MKRYTSQSRHVSLIRGVIAAKALENGMKLKDIGEVFRRDKSTISRFSSRFLNKYHLCESLRRQIQKLKEKSY